MIVLSTSFNPATREIRTNPVNDVPSKVLIAVASMSSSPTLHDGIREVRYRGYRFAFSECELNGEILRSGLLFPPSKSLLEDGEIYKRRRKYGSSNTNIVFN